VVDSVWTLFIEKERHTRTAVRDTGLPVDTDCVFDLAFGDAVFVGGGSAEAIVSRCGRRVVGSARLLFAI